MRSHQTVPAGAGAPSLGAAGLGEARLGRLLELGRSLVEDLDLELVPRAPTRRARAAARAGTGTPAGRHRAQGRALALRS